MDRFYVVMAQIKAKVPCFISTYYSPLYVLEGQWWQFCDVVRVQVNDGEIGGVIVPAVVYVVDVVETQVQLVEVRHVIKSHRIDCGYSIVA